MKKLIFLFSLFLFLSLKGSAQNLVPNPSFEDTVACPDNLSQIDRATGWSSYRQSPDYFNSCSLYGGYAGVPLNQFDFQYPRTGSAYTGIHALLTTAQNAREFMGVQLNHPMNIGQEYFVSFFVNRVGIVSGQGKNIATNKIGILFSTGPYTSSNPAPINNHAHIYTDSIITDTLNWMEISGFFIADSAYQYLSIGNFFQDSLTAYVRFDSAAVAAYYFVEDVTILDSIPKGINDVYPSLAIKIFPNPATNQLTVKSEQLKVVKIYDVLGSIVFDSGEINTSSLQINTSAFAPGVYVAVIKTVGGGEEKRKIIIE